MKKVKLIAPENVVNLYDIMGTAPLIGVEDYTDGIYYGDESLDYNTAQKNQHNYLLDEIGAKKNFRLLDVGCGLGALLETAKERGVIGVGITISENQVKKCKAKNLDVHLMNYRDIPDSWNNKFDGIIANGSLEHFCQPEDAIAGRQDEIYQEMFKIFDRLLDPASYSQKVATTAIHFRERHMDPKKILRHPFLQINDKEAFHFAILLDRAYGGYYPLEDQLKKCAKNFFILEKKVDGTEDYRITSDYWCKKCNRALFRDPKVIFALSKYFLRRPCHTFWTVSSQIGFESWPWQFRGDNPPTRLYRHTWQRIE